MGSQQQFCLRWNNHQTNVMSIFEHLYKEEHLVDVTLACEGLTVKAHKVVLSACSPYFQALFVDNPCPHPIVFLKDVQYHELRTVVDFMYRGEVNVNQEQLNAVLETAEALKVRGLAEVTTTETASPNQTTNGEGDPYMPPKSNTGNGYNEGVGQQGQSHAHHQSHSHHLGGGGDYHSHMLSSSHHHSYLHVHPRSLSPPLNSSGGGPSASPKEACEGGASGGGAKRCLSPTAKRRKAKPRKRLPENTIPSDHDDSDALDLSTASPDLCMDTQDNPYDSNDRPEHLTHIKMEPEEPINDKDYNSNQKKCVTSPVGCNPTTSGPLSTPSSSLTSSSALRMPIIPKLQPLSVSVNCPSANTSHMPSTSAVQSSIIHQDIRRLCQYSRQSQQHKPTWTEEDMVQALEAVQSGRLTYALAARKFDIPKATLHYYVILMKAVEAVRSGRMTAEIAAIKYNVRTSILLDCLFGRQNPTSTIPGLGGGPTSATPSGPADSAPGPAPAPSSTSSSATAPSLASTSAATDTKSSAYK